MHPQNKTMPRTPRIQPKLSTTRQPAQRRATDTYERILDVTAQTLADVGIERLSTNLVCERAELSPPALYRYFPNKYALLSELGKRLMQRQNERIGHWIAPPVFERDAQPLAAALEGLILDTYEVTRETIGGVWIMRAMRAVPALQQIRLDSHAEVTRSQAELLATLFPTVDFEEIKIACRVVVELIYATVELLFDEALDIKITVRTVASMLASHLANIQQPA